MRSEIPFRKMEMGLNLASAAPEDVGRSRGGGVQGKKLPLRKVPGMFAQEKAVRTTCLKILDSKNPLKNLIKP